ncbi:acyltransferase 3 [Labilithrix luteola]|uniref:Acyltransferase 3 n=1 Tax=Labilithrix luteola TaxID=1391654 RepID=A0A0K1Q6L5_9BACT|nr:acyltransferase 3 [Labilithrix luteola]
MRALVMAPLGEQGPSLEERELSDRSELPDRLKRAFSLRRNLRLLFVPPGTHLRPLDGLRALSILWVVVFHAAWYASPFVPIPAYVALLESRWMVPVWRGDFGVDVFFVLSGFLIAGLLIDERERTGHLDLTRFYWRRLLRLWPALLLAAVLNVALIGDHSSMVWANLLYVSNFVPILQGAMGWTWSLAIEEQFYLVCPWLVGGLAGLGASARLRTLAAVIALLVTVGAVVVVSGGFFAIDSEIAINRDFFRWTLGFDHLYVKPWMRAGPLLIGVFAAYLFRVPSFMAALSRRRGLGTAGVVVAFGVAAASTHWPLVVGTPRVVEVTFLATSRTLFGIAVAYVLLLSLSQQPLGRMLGRFLSSRVLYPIGQLAYGAYLVNPIVCAVVHKWRSPLVWEGRASPMVAFMPLDIAGTFVAAAAIYLFVERPFMTLRPGPETASNLVVPAEVPAASHRPLDVQRWLFAGSVALAAVLAWFNRFIQDDAFISFRYARHLAAGHGLVWNVGEPPLQGFTNPLWTLAIALGIRFGRDPVRLSQGLGLACFVIGLVLAGKLAARLTKFRSLGIAVVLGLGLNASFNAHATGGLETQSQAMFVVVVAWCVFRGCTGPSARSSVGWFAGASLAGGLALWSRLDSALLVGPLLLAALAQARRERSVRLALAAALPVTVLGASLAAFGWFVFHNLLPNTFYAKASGGDGTTLRSGFSYLFSFLTNYQFMPLLALAVYPIYLGRDSLRCPPFLVRALMFVAVVWGAYIVAVGGDFMEYRLFVPVLPLVAVLGTWLLSSRGERLVWGFTAASVVGSALFYARFAHLPFVDEAGAVETVRGLDAHLTNHDQDWGEIGRGVRHALACDRDITIAVMAAGAIPYYSDLRTIDMLGLSDPVIAREGVILGNRPGHRRGASLPYLVSKQVNIVLHPWPRSDPDRFSLDYTRQGVANRYVPLSRGEELPKDASIIEIPIAKDRPLRALYLVRDAKVDQCIASGGWRVLPIRP